MPPSPKSITLTAYGNVGVSETGGHNVHAVMSATTPSSRS
jgi:hypothetical protein